MFPINQFNIQTVSHNEAEATFKVEPLPKGYAYTIGTVLRRILLSSIPGSAITSIKLDGVQHEYTTVAGLQDDVLSILLNLKEVKLTSRSDEPVVLTVDVKGDKGKARVVTAADFDPNPMVEISNPDQVITTLADEKAKFKAEITVEKGIGYSLPKEQVREEVGAIPVDAVFSPVKLVSMESKNARVGQQTDLDSLELTVVTDGTVSPIAAVYQAAEILGTMSSHLTGKVKDLMDKKVTEQVEINSGVMPVREEVESAEETQDAVQISDLDLSTRLANALVNSGYEDLRTLDGLTEEEVRNIKGMGEKSYHELKDVLDQNGINLV